MNEQHQQFMQLAIDTARAGMAEEQSPFGAVIVKDGQVVVAAHNQVWANGDCTAHAEVTAIRQACKKLGTIDLSGCEIYSTTEPCPMCFAAIHWAKIERIYYGARIADAAAAGFNELHVSNEKMKTLGGSEVELVGDILRQPCAALFTEWLDSGKAKTY